MFSKYLVLVKTFAERHYLKNFEKKYKKAWEMTFRAVCEEFQRFDALLETSIAEVIMEKENVRIVKTEFRIAGSNESRKSSGNRMIMAVHSDSSIVNLLLIYHKNDLGGGRETEKWQQMIKQNYPEYRGMF